MSVPRGLGIWCKAAANEDGRYQADDDAEDFKGLCKLKPTGGVGLVRLWVVDWNKRASSPFAVFLVLGWMYAYVWYSHQGNESEIWDL